MAVGTHVVGGRVGVDVAGLPVVCFIFGALLVFGTADAARRVLE